MPFRFAWWLINFVMGAFDSPWSQNRGQGRKTATPCSGLVCSGRKVTAYFAWLAVARQALVVATPARLSFAKLIQENPIISMIDFVALAG